MVRLRSPAPYSLGEFPSGQRGQTVNLLSLTSLVRIQLPPPNSSDLVRGIIINFRCEVNDPTVENGVPTKISASVDIIAARPQKKTVVGRSFFFFHKDFGEPYSAGRGFTAFGGDEKMRAFYASREIRRSGRGQVW